MLLDPSPVAFSLQGRHCPAGFVAAACFYPINNFGKPVRWSGKCPPHTLSQAGEAQHAAGLEIAEGDKIPEPASSSKLQHRNMQKLKIDRS